jgi:hypothetical protein
MLRILSSLNLSVFFGRRCWRLCLWFQGLRLSGNWLFFLELLLRVVDVGGCLSKRTDLRIG